MSKENDMECDKPEILKKYGGKCPEEQVLKCHGHEGLGRMKNAKKH